MEHSNFHCSGTLPLDLCVPHVLSPLSDLDVRQNMLEGALNLTHCVNLISFDASFNDFSGALISPVGYNHLHTVRVSNNSLHTHSTLLSLIGSGHVTDIIMANNM